MTAPAWADKEYFPHLVWRCAPQAELQWQKLTHSALQVIIGCCDINACGSRLLACVSGSQAVAPLPITTSTNGTSAVSTPDLRDFEPATVLTCKDLDGQEVSIVRLNVATRDFAGVAHALVSQLQKRPNVESVTVIGALHLPGSRPAAVHHLLLNGAQLPVGARTSTPLPEKAPISDSALAALHHWLLASGIPSVFLLIQGYKPSRQAINSQVAADADEVKRLVDCFPHALRLQLDTHKLASVKFTSAMHADSVDAVTRMMYM